MNSENQTYKIWKEGKYYVAQCLVVEVSSFGKTKAEAIKNLNEALRLYFENEMTISQENNKLTLKEKKVSKAEISKLFRKTVDAFDKAWDERGYTEKDMKRFLKMHLRTPYKKP